MSATIDATDHRFVIKEGVESTYRYHLAQPHKWVSLCGARVMHTSIPLSAWGTKSHLNEKWCEECRQKANAVLVRGESHG